jgi:hypothetical protein
LRRASWFRSYDSSHTLDLGLVVLNVKYDREHPYRWFQWTAQSPGGCYLARSESLKRYSNETAAMTAAETWARRRMVCGLRTLERLAESKTP